MDSKTPLASRACTPSRRDTPRLSLAAASQLAQQLPGWGVEPLRLTRRLEFASFGALMAFVNAMAELAEREDHHPDFCVSYRVLELVISTHVVGGLTENDFILAAKIDQLAKGEGHHAVS